MARSNVFRLLSILASTLIFAACAPVIHTDYTREHDFSAYHNFMWLDASPETETYEAFGGDIFATRLQNAAVTSLGNKGYSNDAPADFLISYHLAEETRAEVRHRASLAPTHYDYFRGYYGFGYRSRYFDYDRTDEIRYYSVGVLTIKIIDADSQKTVWAATRKLSLKPAKTPADADAQLNNSVAEMLAQFPPYTATTF